MKKTVFIALTLLFALGVAMADGGGGTATGCNGGMCKPKVETVSK